MPKYSDFPSDEYEKRCEKAQQLMEKRKLDALFISGKENVSYFSGYRKTNIGKPRGRYVILPREGPPTLILPEGERVKAEEMSWLYPDGIQFVEGDLANESVAKTVKNLRVEEGNIGIEWDGAPFQWTPMRTDMSLADYEDIKNRLSRAKFVDGGGLLWEMRIVKSPREVECLRKACEITYKSVEVAYESLHEGMTERELLETFFLETIKRGGADDPLSAFCHIKSGIERSSIGDPRATTRPVKKSDIVQFDCGAIYKGYYCDMIRLACLHPTTKQQKLLDIAAKACDKGIDMLVPGTPIKEVISKTLEIIEKEGYKPRPFAGHGVGLDVHEPPVLRPPYHDGVIQEGMVIAVEPIFITAEGQFTEEDNVVVTKKGPELLTPLEKKLKWT